VNATKNTVNFETKNVFDLGTGIYTMPDVAAILGLPQAKVRRWLREYWNVHFGKVDQTVFSDGTGKELVTNFYTLIEFFTFYQLRDRGVTAQQIVKAQKVLEGVFKTAYPFATSNILTDGKDVLFTGEVGDIIQADQTLQIIITEILTPFCKKIDFDRQSLANRFFPLDRQHNVVIDPHRQFGQPVVGDTNILTETVFNLYRGGESADFIGRIYDLTPEQVQDAITFHRNAA
jgi:uncharacterized protein (DUF433 family)